AGRVRGGHSFFFQAEDGIRDRNVTGVQTCALPISHRAGVVEPEFRDPVVDGLALAIRGGQGVRLDVPANARQLDDDLGMGGPPVGLEGVDGHPRLALEEQNGLDHAGDHTGPPSHLVPVTARSYTRTFYV